MNILKGNPPLTCSTSSSMCITALTPENVIIDSEITAYCHNVYNQLPVSALMNQCHCLDPSVCAALFIRVDFSIHRAVFGDFGPNVAGVQGCASDASNSCSEQTSLTLVGFIHVSKQSESNKPCVNIT